MKKLVIFIGMLLICIENVCASEKKEVTLDKCVDGDTAWFIKDGEKIKVRFLAIDTPESTTTVEEYGKEASEYTCNLLTEATKIEIEYDSNSEKIDKYNRELVWIFVDGELLQEKIIENGFGEIAYLYGDYKYTQILEVAQQEAKKNQVGMWSNETKEDNTSYIYIGIGIIILIIICIFSKKTRKKVVRKTKSSIKKELKKAYKKL